MNERPERSQGEVRALRVSRPPKTFALALVDAEDYERVLHLCRWRVDPQGYVSSANHSAAYYRLHRVVLGLGKADPFVDHINGDLLDNRKSNLRLASPTLNNLNRAVINGTGSSIYRGVTWHGQAGKWQAKQQLGGRSFYLGLHSSEEEAAKAVAAFRRERGLTNGYPMARKLGST